VEGGREGGRRFQKAIEQPGSVDDPARQPLATLRRFNFRYCPRTTPWPLRKHRGAHPARSSVRTLFPPPFRSRVASCSVRCLRVKSTDVWRLEVFPPPLGLIAEAEGRDRWWWRRRRFEADLFLFCSPPCRTTAATTTTTSSSNILLLFLMPRRLNRCGGTARGRAEKVGLALRFIVYVIGLVEASYMHTCMIHPSTCEPYTHTHTHTHTHTGHSCHGYLDRLRRQGTTSERGVSCNCMKPRGRSDQRRSSLAAPHVEPLMFLK